MKLFASMLKLLGEFSIILAIVMGFALIILATPPVPIVSVVYHGQDEVRVGDVLAVLVWDQAQKRRVPVANPQEWFANNQDGRYEISYDAPPNLVSTEEE